MYVHYQGAQWGGTLQPHFKDGMAWALLAVATSV